MKSYRNLEIQYALEGRHISITNYKEYLLCLRFKQGKLPRWIDSCAKCTIEHHLNRFREVCDGVCGCRGRPRDWRDICYTCIVEHRIRLLENDLQQCDACSCECRHEFEVDPDSPWSKLCHKCGTVMIRDIDRGGGQFDSWNAGRCYGPRTPIRQPQCTMKTNKGDQCIHPCQPGRDMCRRHFNFSQTVRCQHTLKTGRPCGKICRGKDTLCYRHLNSSQATRCQHTLKTGRPCEKICQGEDTLCRRHLKPTP